MDSSIWVIILFAIMAILSDKLGKKPPKRMPPFPPRDVDRTLPPPMPEPWGKAERGEKNVPFEIPDIKGAPLPQGMTDEGGIYREPGTKMQDMLEAYREEMADKARAAAYEAQRRAEETAIRAEEEAAYAQQAGLAKKKTRAALPSCRASRRIRYSRPSSWPRYWEDQRHTAIIPRIVGVRQIARMGEVFSDFLGRLFL